MHTSLLKLFLLSCLFLLPMAMIIHPFEVPDENAHYSSLNFMRYVGRMPTLKDPDNLSLEEYQTEEIFGIVEHQNKYSYHPEFRLEYVSGYLGKYEELIHSLNTLPNRTTFQTHQAAIYPPLYYTLALPLYHLVDGSDLLTRVFVIRLLSVVLTGLLIVLVYALGYLVTENKYLALLGSLLTLLYPMTAYIGAGFNSDNLHNLLFGLGTYLCILLLKNGWQPTTSLAIGSVIGLDLLTKPQGYILLPLYGLAALLRFRWEYRSWIKHTPLILLPILLLAGWQEIPKFVGGNPYAALFYNYTGWSNFRIFLAGYLRTHLAEMPVWYWGVFKWFGVILPKIWWWSAIRLVGISGIGLILSLWRDYRSSRFSFTSRFILFALLANALYALSLFWFDWQFYQQFGRSLGLQARYYMPLLSTQMLLLLLGVRSLGWNNRVKDLFCQLLVLFFVGLQLASLYTQLTSYYNLSPLPVFLSQISQYKPAFAKGSWWYLWFSLYFLGIISSLTLIFTKIGSQHEIRHHHSGL